MAGELTKAELNLPTSKPVKLLPTLKPRRLLVVMLHQPTALSPNQRLSQRTTTRATKTIWLISQRRSLHSVPVSLRPASQTKVASKTRSGQTPRPLLRRKKRTSLLPLLERPSGSGSASRSRPSTLISALSRPLSHAEDVEVEAVAEVEANSEAVAKVEDEEDVVMALREEAVADPLEEALRPSTPVTPMPSQVWEHKVSSQELKVSKRSSAWCESFTISSYI